MKAFELIDKLTYLAKNCKTKYMWGTFGNRITPSLIEAKAKQYPTRYSENRKVLLAACAKETVWGFDCSGLIKGVLWGFCDNGGGSASYCSHGVPDLTAGGIMERCKNVSSPVSEAIPAGAAVYMPGHIGVYLGGGKVAEATLSSRGDGVVISPLSAAGWQKYGLLPWVDYSGTAETRPETQPTKIEKGSVVRVKKDAKIYRQNGKFASFVYQMAWIVSEVRGDRAVIDKSLDGRYSICSPVAVEDLEQEK